MLRLFLSWKELQLKLIFENEFDVVENEILFVEIKSVQINEEKIEIVNGKYLSENIDVGIQCNIIQYDILKVDKVVEISYIRGMSIDCFLLIFCFFMNLY